MNINLKASGFELTPAIRDNVSKKLQSVQKLLSKFDSGSEVKLDFEVAKTTRHHQKGDVFRAEANLLLPKKLIRAEAVEEELSAAIDKVKGILLEAVKKYKELNS
jgi:ribosomal subunit interface protein